MPIPINQIVLLIKTDKKLEFVKANDYPIDMPTHSTLFGIENYELAMYSAQPESKEYNKIATQLNRVLKYPDQRTKVEKLYGNAILYLEKKDMTAECWKNIRDFYTK
jgi:hypothetical protein